MKIVFFGTSEFSARILQDLLSKSFDVVAVVTRPDKPQGRALQLVSPPVKKYLDSIGSKIPVYQPEKASNDEFSKLLASLEADIFLVVAYGEILKQNILDLPKKACINIHASLLPKYRGAAPIHRCLLDGATETGVTIIEMVRQMDAGDMLAKSSVPITTNMTFHDLEGKLLELSFDLVSKVLNDFDSFYKNKLSQDSSQVSFADKITPSDTEIFWRDDSDKSYNKIRAFSPAPGAWCKVRIGEEVKRLKIKKAEVVHGKSGFPGEIINCHDGILVQCGSGLLKILEVQLEGKKVMSYSEFLKGLKNKISFFSE